MLNKKFFIGCDKEYEEAEIVLFGAPFDGTTSYRPGTRFAPSAVREESYGIETYSPYLDRDLCEISVHDAGDLELPFGNTVRALEMIENCAAEIFKDGKTPLMIGGEHLVSLGAIRAAAQKYKDLCIIHFDAHTDLRDDYLGEKLSHATVIKRAHDILGDGRIYQFGIRSGERVEFEFAKSHTSLTKFNFDGLDKCVKEIGSRPVYFTIDLDVLDPSNFPGTGTPEAGGVTFTALLDAIKKVSALNIVGCDAVELCPVYDSSGISVALTCKILRELLLSLTA